MKKLIVAVALLAGCATMPENVRFASSTAEVEKCEYLGIFRNDALNDGAETSLNGAATRAAEAGADTVVIISRDSSVEGSTGNDGRVDTSHSVTVQGYKCSQ